MLTFFSLIWLYMLNRKKICFIKSCKYKLNIGPILNIDLMHFFVTQHSLLTGKIVTVTRATVAPFIMMMVLSLGV